MKLTPKNIGALAHKILKGKHDQAKVVNPKRDWAIGLLIGVIILFGLAGWSAYTYIDNRSTDSVATSETATTVAVYRAAVVEEALQYFDTRQQEFDTAKARIDTIPEIKEPEPDLSIASTTLQEDEDATNSSSTTSQTVATSTASIEQDVVQPVTPTPGSIDEIF